MSSTPILDHEKAARFLDSVLALRPQVAVFDCDGTLWSGDAGADFFYWELERGIVSSESAAAARPVISSTKPVKSTKFKCAVRWSLSTAASPVTC